MNRILEGAKQMVEAVWCDHDLAAMPRVDTTAPARFDRFWCNKCKTTFWVPIPDHRRN